MPTPESPRGEVEDRARIVVDDLERAGGFKRRCLLVAGTTGTGWVDPGGIDSLEAGDHPGGLRGLLYTRSE